MKQYMDIITVFFSVVEHITNKSFKQAISVTLYFEMPCWVALPAILILKIQ